MGIRTDKNWRPTLIFLAFVLLLTALFTSRALLSIALALFLIPGCLHPDFSTQLRAFFSKRLLVGVALLFLIPLLTGLWSQNTHEWLRWTRIKLPLLLLPLGFAGNWQLSRRQWQALALTFLLLIACGCTWSLWQYARDYTSIHQGYLQAKVFATPLENDHVRYSLLVCIGVICACMLLQQVHKTFWRIALWFALVFFTVYLHILSARTGLAGLYLFFIIYTIYLLRRQKRSRAMPLALLLVLLPVAAWLLLPTFRNRIRYVAYDLSFVRQSAYHPGTSDGSRALSLRAGWAILQQRPFGVGSGDVVDETHEWYRTQVPGMLDSDKLYPSSEWLLYGDAAGWIGAALFTLIMAIPLFEKTGRMRIFWISLNIIAAFSLLFDIGLETQFGVFIYAFIMLWWWKWMEKERNAAINHERSIFDNHHLPERIAEHRGGNQQHTGAER